MSVSEPSRHERVIVFQRWALRETPGVLRSADVELDEQMTPDPAGGWIGVADHEHGMDLSFTQGYRTALGDAGKHVRRVLADVRADTTITDEQRHEREHALVSALDALATAPVTARPRPATN